MFSRSRNPNLPSKYVLKKLTPRPTKVNITRKLNFSAVKFHGAHTRGPANPTDKQPENIIFKNQFL